MKKTGVDSFAWFAKTTIVSVACLMLSSLFATASAAAMFPVATGGAVQNYAFDGTNYLVGIESPLTLPALTGAPIGAQLVSATGTTVGPLIATGHTGVATNVAFDGSNYLLIWEDDGHGSFNGETGYQVYGQFISKTGAMLGEAFAISSMGVWFDGNKTMAFGGGRYLVTYTKLIIPANGANSDNRYIAGRVINPDGSMGNEFRISSGYGKASDVAFDGNNFFVVWCEDFFDQEIRGRFVSSAGVPGTEISINNSQDPSDNPKSVAFDGTNYLVAWNDEVGGSGTTAWDVFGQRVSPQGTLLGEVITLTNEPGAQLITSLAFDGSNYLAVWADLSNDANYDGVCNQDEGSCWDVYGRYISKEGNLLESKIAISTDAGNQMGGAGYDNGKYFVLVNSNIVLMTGGFRQADSVYGMFLMPPLAFATVEPSTYQGSSGAVRIPYLVVAGDSSGTAYAVDMQQQGSGFDFTVAAINEAPAEAFTDNPAIFNAATGALFIPYLSIFGDTSGVSFSIDMQLQGQDLNFSVTGIRQN